MIASRIRDITRLVVPIPKFGNRLFILTTLKKLRGSKFLICMEYNNNEIICIVAAVNVRLISASK